MKKLIQNKKGITLLEILLYLSISSMVLLSISVFITSVLRARVKNESIVLVNEEAEQVISQLHLELTDATSINSPAQGITSPSITFQSGGPATTIDLQSGIITYTGNPVVNLNSTNTNVTSLSFTRMTTTSDHESIKVEFTIERNNPNNLNEYHYTKTFYTTINLPRITGEP